MKNKNEKYEKIFLGFMTDASVKRIRQRNCDNDINIRFLLP